MKKESSGSNQMDWCIASGCTEYHGYCPLHERIIRDTRWMPGAGVREYKKLRQLVLEEEGKEKIRNMCGDIIYNV